MPVRLISGKWLLSRQDDEMVIAMPKGDVLARVDADLACGLVFPVMQRLASLVAHTDAIRPDPIRAAPTGSLPSPMRFSLESSVTGAR
jgi:hypothetical protein